jgi:putative transposase
MHPSYPSDLTDDQWHLLESLLPEAKPGGRPRSVDLRAVLNAILYILCAGCPWRYLPQSYPNWKTVYDYFARWRDDGTWTKIHERLRQWTRVVENDRPPHPVWRWPIANRYRRLRWCPNPWAMTAAKR